MTRFDDGGSDPVAVGQANLLRESDKAIQVDIDGIGRFWVPKSVIHDDSEVYGGEGAAGELVVKRWFAKKEGWDD